MNTCIRSTFKCTLEVFMTTYEMKEWDAEYGCVDIVYSLSPIE